MVYRRFWTVNNYGKTWNREEELTIYEIAHPEAGMDGVNYGEFWNAMGVWTFGHPAGLEIEENTVLLIYYAGHDETQLSLRWTRVSVERATFIRAASSAFR